MTRRFIALCLALLLPLQFAWGTAAAYCQHETAPTPVVHFGHHAHAHDDTAQKPAAAPLSVDSDCGYCNAATPQAVSTATVTLPASDLAARAAGVPRALARSVPARAPDRPQWLRLA